MYLVVVFFNLMSATAPPVKLQNEELNRPRDRKRGFIVVTQAPEVLLILHEHSNIQQVQAALEAAALHISNVWICTVGVCVCVCVWC